MTFPGVGVPAKAYLKFEDGKKLTCHFNPEELTWSKTVKWDDTGNTGQDAPRKTFKKGMPATISLKLWFDTTTMQVARTSTSTNPEGTPVSDYTNILLEKLKPSDKYKKDGAASGDKGRPPTVEFIWGNIHSFRAIITKVDINYKFFSPTGMPLRALVNLSLEQFEPDEDWWKQNPTSGTPNPHSLHTVQPGETLDRIAFAHFGDSGKWRLIASANHISNPLALRPGTTLTIPELEGDTSG